MIGFIQEAIGNHHGKIVLFGVLGGFIKNIYDINSNKEMTLLSFFINMFLAGYTPFILDLLAPQDWVLNNELKMYAIASLIGLTQDSGIKALINYSKSKMEKLLS